MSDTNNAGRPADSTGSNPLWPGDKALKPGTIKKDDETTIIPFVDSVKGTQPGDTEKNDI